MADRSDSVTLDGGLAGRGDPSIITDVIPTVDDISLINEPNPLPVIGSDLSGCSQLYNTLLETVQSDISRLVSEPHASLKHLHNAIIGDIQLDFEPALKSINKCDGKIRDRLVESFNDAFVAAFGAGVAPPTEEQIIAAMSGQPIPDAIAPIATVPVPGPLPVPVPVPVAGDIPPIIDPVTGAATCPPASAPRLDPTSPTGYVIDFYQPVVGFGGAVVACRKQTEPTNAPANGGGGQPPAGGGGGSNCTAGPYAYSDPRARAGTGPPGTSFVSCPGDLGGTGCWRTPAQIAACGQSTVPSGGGNDTVIGGGGNDTLSANGDGGCPPCPPPTPPADDKPVDLPKPSVVNQTDLCDAQHAGKALSFIKDNLHPANVTGPTQSDDPSQPNYRPDVGKQIRSIFGDGWTSTLLSPILTVFTNAVKSVLTSAVGAVSVQTGCNSQEYAEATAAGAIYRFINRWTDAVPLASFAELRYAENVLCQYLLPQTGEANAAYSRGYFSQEQWELDVRSNGHCLEWQRLLVEAQKTRIGIRDAYRLVKLGLITQRDFEKDWQRNGIDIENEYIKWSDAQLQYPPFGDLIRMMIRDAADETAVKRGGFDDEFTDKWTGILKQWGESQGVSDDIARMYWRAHWQLPSPGQLYDMLHRLRSDDRNPDDPNRDIVVDAKTVRDTLQQNDFAPGFIAALLAVSYKPLTRVDVRRLYEIGAIDTLTEVRQAYRDLGYDANNAKLLARFAELDSKPKRQKRLGVLPESDVLKAYRDGLITEDEARAALKDDGNTQEQVDAKIKRATQQREIASRKVQVDSIKRRYFSGEFDDVTASGELLRIVPDQTLSVVRVQQWRGELLSRRREPTIAMLCKWFDKGIINLDEYMRRVRNLRYSESDAIRVVEQCTVGIQERKFEAVAKEQKRQVDEAKKAAREAARIKRENQPCRVIKPACPGQTARKATHTVTSKNGKVSTTDTDTTTLTE